jgi:outer membrane protein TolC
MRTLFVLIAVAVGALPLAAQVPAPQTPAPGPFRPGPLTTSSGGTGSAGSLTLSLADAIARARTYTQQVYSAEIAAQIAHEDRVQAKAALLPTLTEFSQFIYTQPNGEPSGTFISNDGAHVYNNQAQVHADLYAPAKRADYQRALASEAAAKARTEIATRGLIAVVVQDYYAMVAARRKTENAEQSLREARQFLDVTQKLEGGGEAAHADVVKAQIQVEQRQRDLQDAQLSGEKARLSFGVLLFADYGQPFSVIDDLDKGPTLPALTEIQAMAANNSPDIRAAQATVQAEIHEVASTHGEMLPSLSADYFYGMNANQFALHNPDGMRNLGSVAQATLTIPVWNWGAARSRVRQAQLRLQQARNDLSLTQRQLLANLTSFYLESDSAAMQVASLRRSMDLSADSLKLTVLRYEAGEAVALEVVDAQTTLAEARNAYADGLVRYRVAVASLQTLTGAF